MRLEKASYKAIKYACLKFHYTKSVPVNFAGYSVFNDANEWCGVILYGSGATPYLGRQFGLKQGQVLELTRIALNGKQQNVSSVISMSIKLIKKDAPLCKAIITYADIDQSHIGVVYQAANFYYLGVPKHGTQHFFIIKGKKTHPKSLYGKSIENSVKGANSLDRNAIEIWSKGKHKYIYPVCKQLIPMCRALAKSYPKKEKRDDSINGNATANQVVEGVRDHLVAH